MGSKGKELGLGEGFPLPEELEKNYEPQAPWADVYAYWESAGCFQAQDESLKDQDAFCIMIPPPNVTGVLHMGHALTNTIQDILVRWRRMKGDNALWMPGTDHAGIATQTVVERALGQEKNPQGKPMTRHDLGREAFIEKVWEWKEEHGNKIAHQQRRLGNSLDWSRERFTMDPGFSEAVKEVFVRLFEEGLIYRGERIINWCTVSQTALSDLEVIPKETQGALYHIRYEFCEEDGSPLKDSNGEVTSIVIATTRPETLLGDTAVAVHPADSRYTQFHGKFLKLPLLGRVLPLITDEHVDQTFGTGGLKVTPAHDFDDYEIGKRHSLPFVSVIGKDGKITAAGGPFAGLSVSEARNQVIQSLKEKGFLEKTEPHVHQVGYSQRSDQVAEPLLSKQWFVKIKPLAEPAIKAVESGEIQFSPKTWEKTYFEWMYHIRDWCISRQLWWGHQIPAWHCQTCQEITVSRTTPKKCQGCGESTLIQDEDVLDTWFSSALWPFATLGWPESTKALKTFYPNTILETGFDIIFFWVARMIMMGIHFMGEVPFSRVYLHAMVRDEKGEKMSKSKGNVIDPLELIETHGADPLRFTLAIMAGQGRDIKLSEQRVAGYQAFCNKLWNATKFLHFNLNQPELKSIEPPKEGVSKWVEANHAELGVVNRWIVSRLQRVIEKVDHGLEHFELNESSQALYDFTWHEFCDWFVELSKLGLRASKNEQRETLYVLHYILEKTLRLLHPFIPFVTERLWQSLKWKEEAKGQFPSIMLQAFPEASTALVDVAAEKTIQSLQQVIDAIRNFRGENRIPPKKEIPIEYFSKAADAEALIKLHAREIQSLAKVSELSPIDVKKVGEKDREDALFSVIPIQEPSMELRINLAGLVDIEEETRRLEKEIQKCEADLAHVLKKLSNPSFVDRAPKVVVEKERQREKELRDQKSELLGTLNRLQKPAAMNQSDG